MADPRLAHIERQNPSGGGLLILGEASGADDEEAQALSTPPFVHARLRRIANLIGQDCHKIQHLPDHLVAQETGMQGEACFSARSRAASCIFCAARPRTIPQNFTAGGLGLPDLQALALAARRAALATIPGEKPLAAYKEELLATEGPALLAQLQAQLAHPVAELVGDLRQMPEGKSTRQLSRKLMHGIRLHSVRTLRRTEGEMPAAMRHNWARNRSTDGGTAATAYTSQGAWLRATPSNAAYTVANETFRFNIGHRLGLVAPGAG